MNLDFLDELDFSHVQVATHDEHLFFNRDE